MCLRHLDLSASVVAAKMAGTHHQGRHHIVRPLIFHCCCLHYTHSYQKRLFVHEACSQVVDPNSENPLIGGCRFEMPLGSCKDSEPEDSSVGCASVIEAAMNSALQINAGIVLFFTLFQLISVISGCCLCWKRKRTDVIPSYLERPPVDPYVKPKQRKIDISVAVKMPPIQKAMIGSEHEIFSFTPSLPDEVEEPKADSKPAL